MKNLIVLVKMQLKEKLNLKQRKANKKKFFNIIFPIVLSILKFEKN